VKNRKISEFSFRGIIDVHVCSSRFSCSQRSKLTYGSCSARVDDDLRIDDDKCTPTKHLTPPAASSTKYLSINRNVVRVHRRFTNWPSNIAKGFHRFGFVHLLFRAGGCTNLGYTFRPH